MKKAKKVNPMILIQLLLGACLGFFSAAVIDSISFLAFTFILLSAFYIQIIVHEGGHLICGLLSGYKFISFRIGSLTFVMENERLKLSRHRLAGTGGQCLMAPPYSESLTAPYFLYNIGGALANLLFAVFAALLLIFVKEHLLWSAFFKLSIILSLFFAFTNAIPMKSSVPNDGHNIKTIKNDSSSMRGFYVQLSIVAQLSQGIRFRDMPEEWFEIPKDGSFSSALVASIGIFKVSRLYDELNFTKAKELCEQMLMCEDLIELYKNELRCELLFLELISDCNEEKIKELYTKPLQKYIKATISYMSRARLMYAYHHIYTKNDSECSKILKQFEKNVKTAQFKPEVQTEQELMSYVKKQF